MYIQGQGKITVSRKKQSLGGKRYNPLDVGYKALIASLNVLQKSGYITQVIASHTKDAIATIKPTDKLIQWFTDTEWSNDRVTKTVGTYVTLREIRKQNNHSVYADFKDTKYSKWLSERIREYDQLLNSCKISLVGVDEVVFNKFTVQREFVKYESTSQNMEFSFGGKISAPWEDMPSKFRKHITINGEATVELSVDTSDLDAMYKVIAGSPHSQSDPYHTMVDGKAILKHIVKNFSLFMQGSKSPKAAAHSVLNHYKRSALEVKNPKEIDVNQYEEYVELKRLIKPMNIAQAFLGKHPKIADYYNRGKAYGDFIACWESDIAFEVLMELTKKDIPCLRICNSFVIPAQYEELAKNMIDSASYVDRRSISKDLPTKKDDDT
ncbi:hypothetical protein CRYPA_927 [uncultured Candidatus Thioglobus sp.]|nr:hypothetical protein CRYPA_927 [uncultured Candidatus Thioglobus sp.]